MVQYTALLSGPGIGGEHERARLSTVLSDRRTSTHQKHLKSRKLFTLSTHLLQIEIFHYFYFLTIL